MLKSPKSQLSCSFCSRIFKDPILLLCNDSICRQHLSGREVVKQNKIKCKKCNEEFGVKNNEFKSNEAMSKLIDGKSYLSVDEIKLKHELKVSIKKFFESYDEFIQKKSKLEYLTIFTRCASKLINNEKS